MERSTEGRAQGRADTHAEWTEETTDGSTDDGKRGACVLTHGLLLSKAVQVQ
jgi:hypothetical protein